MGQCSRFFTGRAIRRLAYYYLLSELVVLGDGLSNLSKVFYVSEAMSNKVYVMAQFSRITYEKGKFLPEIKVTDRQRSQ